MGKPSARALRNTLLIVSKKPELSGIIMEINDLREFLRPFSRKKGGYSRRFFNILRHVPRAEFFYFFSPIQCDCLLSIPIQSDFLNRCGLSSALPRGRGLNSPFMSKNRHLSASHVPYYHV